jgi:hypothetical protein
MDTKNAFTLNWKQAAAEVFLIVIGVSIALAADSWLAERDKAERTERLLNSLEAEWAADLKYMDANLEEVGQAMPAIRRMIGAHDNSPQDLTAAEAASLLEQAWDWHLFLPSDGALNTLLVDGVQNIEDAPLRLAIGSWRSTLDSLANEKAALNELGTVDDPRIGTIIAQESGKAFPVDATEYPEFVYGMEMGDFALAAIGNDEWVALYRHTLAILYRYQQAMLIVRDKLEQNLTLLRERANN